MVSAGSLTPTKRFQRVFDPAEIHMTPLKFQIVVLGPQLFFKGNIPQNYFIGKFNKKKVGEF
jgi:hypothetical protein